MFQQSFGIFGCDNAYNCIETFILAALSTATLYFFIRAYILIRKDQAQILDKTDKLIFYLASVHSGLLSFALILYTNPFLIYTIRALYLTLVIVVCSVAAFWNFSAEIHPRIRNAMWIALIWTGILWFFSVVNAETLVLQNECGLINFLMFSISAAVISSILLLCGLGSIQQINKAERSQSVSSQDEGHNLWQIRRFQELKERKIILMTFIAVNMLASFVQLLWDIKKYDINSIQTECDTLSFSHNFLDMILFIILKILCNLLPSWGIYYLYYWRNREHFCSNNQVLNRHLNDFDELRSDMIELA